MFRAELTEMATRYETIRLNLMPTNTIDHISSMPYNLRPLDQTRMIAQNSFPLPRGTMLT